MVEQRDIDIILNNPIDWELFRNKTVLVTGATGRLGMYIVEAINKAEELSQGSNKYPVHYSSSNTSGEKAYEEFYTDEETADFNRMKALGVVTGKEIPNKEKVAELFIKLNNSFESETSKEEIVAIMKEYLPNFEHIETGKSLDSKM